MNSPVPVEPSMLLERVGAARELIARVGAGPGRAGEVRDAARGERIGVGPRRAVAPIDPQEGDDLVAGAVDRRGDQRAAVRSRR